MENVSKKRLTPASIRSMVRMSNAGCNSAEIAATIGSGESTIRHYLVIYRALAAGEPVPQAYAMQRRPIRLICDAFGFDDPKPAQAEENPVEAEQLDEPEQMQLNLDAQPQEAPTLDIENLKEYLRNLSEALSIMNDSIETIKSTQRKELEMIMMLKNREPVEPNKCKKCGRTIPMGYSFCFECNKERLAK